MAPVAARELRVAVQALDSRPEIPTSQHVTDPGSPDGAISIQVGGSLDS